MAVDVAKAYDSVDRDRLLTVLQHMGVTNNRFFALWRRSLECGKTAIRGEGHMSEAWVTTRGIK